MQRVAFLIIANAWLKLYIEQKSRECSSLHNDTMTNYDQLRMFLTGPGGTGKTYVIGGLTKLMVSYNCEHCIRYLAPTSGVVKLIGGMIIHKGLGIAIKQKKEIVNLEKIQKITLC